MFKDKFLNFLIVLGSFEIAGYFSIYIFWDLRNIIIIISVLILLLSLITLFIPKKIIKLRIEKECN